jgi:hypothetical protein
VTKETLYFYLLGREDSLLRIDLDADEMASTFSKGNEGDIHSVISRKVTDWDKAQRSTSKFSRKKKGWLAENDDDIKSRSVDPEVAHSAYRQGQIDEYIYASEPLVIEKLQDIAGIEPEGEDGEETEPEDDGDDE